MRYLSFPTIRRLRSFLPCTVMAILTLPAFAVKPSEVNFNPSLRLIQGQCCTLWDQSVSVTEPTVPVPVVLTWSSQVSPSAAFLLGLSVNGQPCHFYGPAEINSIDFKATFQWVVQPSDGLHQGKNTFRTCGGSQGSPSDQIYLGDSSLAAQVGNAAALRVTSNLTVSGVCCSDWGELVQVTEPSKVGPVVVTWSSDYLNSGSGDFVVGLRVNAGACTTYGSGTMTPAFGTQWTSALYQWILYPTDGLHTGTNTFSLCGGGPSSSSTMTLGYNTLAARMKSVNPAQLLRELANQVFSLPKTCCVSLGEAVQVKEPSTVQPVVVTFSGDIFSKTDNDVVLGVSVNGGGCIVFAATPTAPTSWNPLDLAFVLEPNVLQTGNNSITACGYSFLTADTVTLGQNSLAVRIAN